ncbi:mycothiol acetyltransferase [mine drainage metagenome]|uniref:Mycothiol acetyltransferase n=1 Tax=mine drainage metagenome TaxID=410659 RepID=A0A1J5QRI1_9ZZZZ
MGRLAVDQAFKGQGLGGALVADALDRAARSEIAACALMVDAKDDVAAAFYRHHGFITLPDSPPAMFLPLTIVLASRDAGDNARSVAYALASPAPLPITCLGLRNRGWDICLRINVIAHRVPRAPRSPIPASLL